MVYVKKIVNSTGSNTHRKYTFVYNLHLLFYFLYRPKPVLINRYDSDTTIL
jgi:hypothetical protein